MGESGVGGVSNGSGPSYLLGQIVPVKDPAIAKKGYVLK